MIRTLTITSALLLAHVVTLTAADPPIVLGSPLVVDNTPIKPGGFAEVRYKLESGDAVQWEVTPTPVSLKEHTEYSLDKDGKATPNSAVLHLSGLDKEYTVTAFVINFEKRTFERKKVTVPFGVKPKPDDDKKPPPAPADLKKKIAEAFAADKGTRADAILLSALYKQAADLAQDVKKSPNSRELLRQVREAGNGLVGEDSLLSVRVIAAEELAKILGSPSDNPLTEQQRTQTAETFLKLSAALDALVSG